MLKGMMGLIPAIVVGGAAIGQVGANIGAMGAGIAGATQSMIGVGIFGKAAGVAKKAFKW